MISGNGALAATSLRLKAAIYTNMKIEVKEISMPIGIASMPTPPLAVGYEVHSQFL